MMKKAATQSGMKDMYDKLLQRVKTNVDTAEKLMEQTHLPAYTAVPDASVLTNLLQECEDSDFW